jgi:peptide/nickel transport system ATP-binding protein
MTHSLLEVRNLSVRLTTARGPAYAVRDLSFTLARGETLGLVGESGCGKSMTALALLGLTPESAQIGGEVLFQGRSLLALEERELAALRGNRIAMIFQEPMTALNPLQTVGAQIAEALRLHKGTKASVARTQAIALLDRVGIADARRRVDAYPHQLSGGQRQRVTIAMALACDPDLLIADEPTTALDVTVAQQILELIAALVAERGMGLLLISHDLGVIAANVGRVMVMYGGMMVETGPSPQVFRELLHPYSQGLFAARPRIGAARIDGRRPRLATIAGSVPELVDMPQGCAFANRCERVIADCRLAIPALQAASAVHTVRCLRALE